jgi:hypothetical protein
MNTLEKFFAHQKRWNIEIDDQAAFQTFKNRVLQLLERYINGWSTDFWAVFPRGLNFLLGYEAINGNSYRSFPDKFLGLLRSSQNTKELVHYFQTSFIVVENRKERQKEYHVEDLEIIDRDLFGILSTALEYTPQVGIEVIRTNNQVILYPKGTKLLDEAVINQNLVWLESHPSVLRHFEQALTQYMTGDKKQQRNLLDNLRFSLEQLLKDILRNDKTLENQQVELLGWLKKQGVHQQTINMYNALLFGPYKQFQNDAVKHEEEFTENDIEFMIYTTGTFMRLLLKLEQNAHATTSQIDNFPT